MLRLFIWCILLTTFALTVKADIVDETYSVELNSGMVIFSLDKPKSKDLTNYERKFFVPETQINFITILSVYNRTTKLNEDKFQVYFSNNFYSLFISKEDAKMLLETISKSGFSKKKMISSFSE